MADLGTRNSVSYFEYDPGTCFHLPQSGFILNECPLISFYHLQQNWQFDIDKCIIHGFVSSISVDVVIDVLNTANYNLYVNWACPIVHTVSGDLPRRRAPHWQVSHQTQCPSASTRHLPICDATRGSRCVAVTCTRLSCAASCAEAGRAAASWRPDQANRSTAATTSRRRRRAAAPSGSSYLFLSARSHLGAPVSRVTERHDTDARDHHRHARSRF